MRSAAAIQTAKPPNILAVRPFRLASRTDSPFTAKAMAFPDLHAAPDASPDDLLRRVGRSQDRQAFARLFDHFAPRLNAYMRKLGADPAAAEELVQETMLTVWRKAPLFDPGKANANTWIYTIARNKRIDSIRRQRPEYSSDDLTLVPAEQPDNDAVDTAEQQHKLEQAIAELPPEQADLLRLAYYEDMPHSEIAERRHLPLGTVKSRLRLAMDKLRNSLSRTDFKS